VKKTKQTASSNFGESLRHCLERPRKIRRIPWRSFKTSRWFTITKVSTNRMKEEGESDQFGQCFHESTILCRDSMEFDCKFT